MMSDINEQYEKKHLDNIKRTNRRIKKAYEEAILELALTASRITYNGEVFTISKYPQLKAVFDKVLKELQANIYTTVVNSITDAWNLSNKKNNVIIDKRLAKRNPTKKAYQVLYDPNKGALDAYIKRKEKGLNLSKRVWDTQKPLKVEMEHSLGIAISEGKPAAEIARDVKKYLNNPDKLFRRVREIKGDPNSKLKLSSTAKNYSPGQGMYRSSYKNALRLAVTETNTAYRSADHERWNNMPFVKGVEVKLSNNHPNYDICDSLAGVYPVDYKFTGWHPNCRCFAVPILANDEEYEKIEDAILEGKEPPPIKRVEKIPDSAAKYLKENAKRINGWSNKPYFIKDNEQYLGKLLGNK
jgi:hypothetical protein